MFALRHVVPHPVLVLLLGYDVDRVAAAVAEIDLLVCGGLHSIPIAEAISQHTKGTASQ